jgi:hypothetical protein
MHLANMSPLQHEVNGVNGHTKVNAELQFDTIADCVAAFGT